MITRNHNQLTDWMDTLGNRDQGLVLDRITSGSLDYEMTLEQAERYEVPIGGVLRSLLWVTNNKPLRLESMMDTMPPGSVLFHAVSVVYNANMEKILKQVDQERRRIRDAGIEGLHRSKHPLQTRPITGKLTVRPIKRRILRVQLQPRPTRIHLKPQGIRRILLKVGD